jgi:hypothetical protein
MYLFDADTLILANRHDFPLETNPGKFWNFVEEMGRRGQARIPESVYDELERGGDNLFAWVNERKDVFLIHKVEALPSISQVLEAYGDLSDLALETISRRADPFLVAHALTANAIIVTNETLSNATNPINKQIPDICQHVGASYIRYPRFLWDMHNVLTF